MQTKQQQKIEFEKEFGKYFVRAYPNLEAGLFAKVMGFWLQKQDQLLTELGDLIHKEKTDFLDKSDQSKWGEHYKAGEKHRTEMYNMGIDKALTLINKYK